jgi:hypothetical protein
MAKTMTHLGGGANLMTGTPWSDERSITARLVDLVPVIPDDAADLPDGPCRAICLAEAGDLAIVTLRGESRVLPSGLLAPGVLHPIGARRVLETGTTATGIHAGY